MKKLLKSTILALLAPICCACGSGGGGGATDDNNVLYFKDRSGQITDYFFKGSLRLAVYNTEVANKIFDSQPSGAPEAVRNDCAVSMCSMIATMIKDSNGKLSIPLYDETRGMGHYPLPYWTEMNDVNIDGWERHFSFLEKNTWKLSSSINLFFYFVPAHTTGVECFKSFKYSLKIKGNFVYYPERPTNDKVEPIKNEINIDRDDLSHSCYNNSIVLEPVNLGFPEESIDKVWYPTIELDSLSGTITPEFKDSGQWNHIQDYLRKDV